MKSNKRNTEAAKSGNQTGWRVVRHSLCSLFIILLTTACGDNRCRTPFGDGVDLYLSEEEQYIPDGMIVCDPGKIQANGVHGAPDLVVEVQSPSTASIDRGHKKAAYARFGVREYWIVSPSEKTVEQYVLKDGDFVMRQTYAVYPDWMLEKMDPAARTAVATAFKCSLFDDLTIRLEDVFARVP